MQEFERITITPSLSKELLIYNPTALKLLDKGAHGAVFQLSEDKCVKIYAYTDIAKMEIDAYKMSQHSSFVPKLYESGINYIVMEYIEGVSMLQFLSEKNEIPYYISKQLIELFKEMQSIGFTRIDSSLRHIIIQSDGSFKVIDHVNSYNVYEKIPNRALVDLKKLSLLLPFLKHLEEIDHELYIEWYPGICQHTNSYGM